VEFHFATTVAYARRQTLPLRAAIMMRTVYRDRRECDGGTPQAVIELGEQRHVGCVLEEFDFLQAYVGSCFEVLPPHEGPQKRHDIGAENFPCGHL